MRHTIMGLCPLLMITCNIEDRTDRIEVTEPNQLGITSLEAERIEHGFELRALSAQGEPLASVHMRIGLVSDIKPGEESYGTEIQFAVADRAARVVTSATKTIRLDAEVLAEPSIRSFLALGTVSSVLAREANLDLVRGPAPSAERPYETWVGSCADSFLMTSPLAKQCCMRGADGTFDWQTYFFRTSDGFLASRYRNPDQGTPCRDWNGDSCSGTSCDYGPIGFSRANLIAPPPGGWAIGYLEESYGLECWPHDANDGAGYWTDVTGTRTTGAGCCIDGSGPCDGDYATACTSCGGGGAAGRGSWDY